MIAYRQALKSQLISTNHTTARSAGFPQLRSPAGAESTEFSSGSLNQARSFGQASYSPATDFAPSLMGHNFGQVQVNNGIGASHYEVGKKLRVGTNPHGSGERGRILKGISESGSGTVNIDYAPEATDTSSKIVFIQVMREYLDDTAVKPSEIHASYAYQDADTTGDFYHVDYDSGEADPYYNGDDAADGGTQGNATSTPKVTAHMDDTPNVDDAHFPAGKKKIKFEFRSIAFSAAGADKGTFYAYAKWFYEKEKGTAGSTRLDGTSTDTALPKSKEAIKLFCTNHGFVLPT